MGTQLERAHVAINHGVVWRLALDRAPDRRVDTTLACACATTKHSEAGQFAFHPAPRSDRTLPQLWVVA